MSDNRDSIEECLDDIKAILLIANASKIQELKEQIMKGESEESKIYRLCDGKTTEEIAKQIRKSPEYVRSNLSRLRRKGLIKTIERNSKAIHEHRF